jgi:hypothetical protein
LEERGVKYAIRLPANDCLERDIADLLSWPGPRGAPRPSSKPAVRYKNFLHQAASWKQARRVVAKVEFRGALWAGELFPRVGFIVTNLESESRGRATELFLSIQRCALFWRGIPLLLLGHKL